MAKGFRTFESKTKTLAKPEITLRQLPPKITETKNGAQILCPFCPIPHPIAIGKESVCGTTLHVTAMQTVLPARTVNKHKLVCFKCKQGGGEMVRFNQGFIHAVDCAPDTKLLAGPPEFSRWARIVHQLPDWLRKPIEKRTGRADIVHEVDPEGTDTGKVLGYFFYKRSNSMDRVV
jgi:hypothetical protein